VAAGVIDLLEADGVDEGEDQRLPGAIGTVDLPLDGGKADAASHHPGERVEALVGEFVSRRPTVAGGLAAILTAGVAGLVGGASSMAAGR
jgi:hypothetical protein